MMLKKRSTKIAIGCLILSCLGITFTSVAGGPAKDAGTMVKSDAGKSAQLTPAQIKLGKRAFIRCQACHTLGEGEEHRTGPNLHGLFSATVGKKEDFVYSEALAKSDMQWNDETLRQWLKSPATFIAGNKMAFAGVPSEKEMNALMAYLQEKTK